MTGKVQVMKRVCVALALAVFTAAFGAGDGWCASAKSGEAVLVVQGKVLDSTGSPLSDATVLPHACGNSRWKLFLEVTPG
jgi:hypothetical protein